MCFRQFTEWHYQQIDYINNDEKYSYFFNQITAFLNHPFDGKFIRQFKFQ